MTEKSISSPLSVIDNELLRLFTSGKTADSETHLTQLFDDLDDIAIPPLTQRAIRSGSLPANSLVRIRCLVQDMLDVEFYSSIFKTKTGELLFSKYRDRITSSASFREGDVVQMYDELEEIGVTGERVPLICVPIPGENEWVHSCTAPDPASIPPVIITDSGLGGHVRSTDEGVASHSKKRRTADSMDIIESENQTCCLLKIYDNTSSGRSASSAPSRPVRLNDMLEVIGVYTPDDTHELLGTSAPPMTSASSSSSSCHDTRLAGFEELMLAEEQDMGMDLDMENIPADVRQECTYPSRLFPRVHCLRFHVLPSTYPLPTPTPLPSSTSGGGMQQLETSCPPPAAGSGGVDALVAYGQVVEALQVVLLGDRLAAEYTALMLISHAGLNSAQQNKVEGQNFGNVSLNLCNAISDDAAADIRITRLRAFLRDLLPRSTLVEVNIDSLNTDTLFVSKQAVGVGVAVGGERTDVSLLQLGAGTAVLLDESHMGEGVLQGNGLKNIRALKGILNEQQLLVECNYYDIHIPTDVSAIIFSKVSSILSTSTTIQLPLQALSTTSTSTLSTQMHADTDYMDVLDEEDMDIVGSEEAIVRAHITAMRQWWATSRSLPKPSMDAAVVQAAERDFLLAAAAVEEGQTTLPAVTSSVLHRWILTAQLVALAEGASSVSIAHWGRMQEMETQLQSRRTLFSTC